MLAAVDAIIGGEEGSFPSAGFSTIAESQLRVFGDRLVFVLDDGEHGHELARPS